MKSLPDEMLYEGVSVDISFGDAKPGFGDLFLICGETHPRFPPTGTYGFDKLADLQFDQVDDYFGVQSLSDEGDDVVIWLFPLVNGEPVDHHPGPFDGIRLSYNVLRNPAHRVGHFIRCVQSFAALGVSMIYRERQMELGSPPDLSPVVADIKAISQHWSKQGITIGSTDALEIDY